MDFEDGQAGPRIPDKDVDYLNETIRDDPISLDDPLGLGHYISTQSTSKSKSSRASKASRTSKTSAASRKTTDSTGVKDCYTAAVSQLDGIEVTRLGLMSQWHL